MAGRRSALGVAVLASLTICGLVALTAGRTHAAISVFVPCTGAGGGSQGLIQAIQTANNQSGGTILLDTGCTYTLSNPAFSNGNGPDGLPPIESAITINGNNSTIARNPAAPNFRLFEVSDGPAGVLTVNDLKLQGGDAGPSGPATIGGGAIFVDRPGALFVYDSVFTNNKSADGGAIASRRATVRITNGTFRNNLGTEDTGGTGGALANQGGRLIINNSLISGNTSTAYGGGIHSPAGGVKITNTTIENNKVNVNGAGGGIFSGGVQDPAELVVLRSTLSGNQAMGFGGNGGGIANYDNGTLTLEDSTISGNTAGDPQGQKAIGGGIVNYGDGTVTTTTIANNRVVGDEALGGGIVAREPLTVTASIVALNAGLRNCAGEVQDGGFNLEDQRTCGFTKNAVIGNPLLGPLANNGGLTKTRALQPNSPAINKVPAARPYCGGTTDQRGVKRPQGPACDIGSYELKNP
jgi:predicted outer membrane repeat protein